MRIRNKSSVFVILLLFLTGGCGGKEEKVKVQQESGSPELKLNKEIYYFGEIKEGDVVGKYIWLKNDGTGVLMLNNILSSCGCIDVKYDKKPVLPGDSAKIEVIFDTNGFYGKQVKFLKIFSNDKKNKETEIMLWADIKNP